MTAAPKQYSSPPAMQIDPSKHYTATIDTSMVPAFDGRVSALAYAAIRMHWYGWTLTTLLGAGVLGFIAAKLPEGMTRRIPLALTWITPLAAIPVLIYALRFFWRW